jgi:transposase
MAKSLSNDLRERLVEAVEGGMSRRAAAKRFGVAASTAIKWVSRWRLRGSVAALPRGGDTRSHAMEQYAGEILAHWRPESSRRNAQWTTPAAHRNPRAPPR